LQQYTAALAAFPNDRDARINSAIALEKLGRTSEALDAYRYYLTMTGHNNIPGSKEYAEEKVQILAPSRKAER
jgi:Flp pilus assembly protein TadD